jgi:outer membrane protein TolC
MRSLLHILFLLLFLPLTGAHGQLTLDACREKARANYPLIRQYGLIEKSAEYNLSNAGKGYLPQVSLLAKITYQSEVTSIPIDIPGIPEFALSRDQYQAITEVNQVLWDGGVIQSQKKVIKQSAEVEKQGLEVSLYALNERVNQLFFGVLLIREQLNQSGILLAGWQNNIDRVQAGIRNGIAGEGDLDALKVEQLRTRQRITELESLERSYLQMLMAMTGEPVEAGTTLIRPYAGDVPGEGLINRRPELNWFDSQKNLLAHQNSSIHAANRPRVALFLQGGYGKPGLNILNNEFSPFYVGGARLTWNFSGLYSTKNNLGKIGISGQQIDLQRDVFLYNNNLASIQQTQEINKIRELIGRDDEIIILRENIRKTSEVKVENGTLSVSELIRDIQAEDLARQEKSLHEMQLVISVYTLKNLTNN